MPMGDSPTLAHSWSPDGNFVVLGEWIGSKAPVLRLLATSRRGRFPSCPDRKVCSTRSGHLMAANIAADAWGGPRNGTWIYNVSTHEWNRLPLVDYGYWA